MQIVGDDTLCLSASGTFFDQGGLECVDLESLQSQGLVHAESDGLIGADLGAFVFVTPTEGYLDFSTDLIESTHLVAFDTAGFVGSELISIVAYRTPTLLHDAQSDTILLPHGQNRANGLHVFAAADGRQLTTSPAPLPGPPTDIALVCDGAVACGDPACPPPPSCNEVPGLGAWGAICVALGLIAAAAMIRSRPRPGH